MRILLIGATGFIGRHLVRALARDGIDCTVVSRSGRDPWSHPAVRILREDPAGPGTWRDRASGADAVVNLAGEPLVDPWRRWTAARKRALWDSRVGTTRSAVAAIRSAHPAPPALVNASAVGYYGDRGEDVLDESAAPGNGFLADLSAAWERAAREAEPVCRVVLLRTGIVLGKDGGVLARLLPMFRAGLGGPWGSGTQWWPWIHVADAVGLIRMAIERQLSGPVNLTAPEPVTVAAFARALAKAVRRPAALRAPAALLRLALGEAADAMLVSQRVTPRRATEAGYRFRFPELEAALSDLFPSRPPATP
jgi:hypothetical protein